MYIFTLEMRNGKTWGKKEKVIMYIYVCSGMDVSRLKQAFIFHDVHFKWITRGQSFSSFYFTFS